MITKGFCEDILARHDDETELKLLAKAWIEHERALAAFREALKPFADAWNEFEFEGVDGRIAAKDRINGELDCSLDIQIKHWRRAAIALAERSEEKV